VSINQNSPANRLRQLIYAHARLAKLQNLPRFARESAETRLILNVEVFGNINKKYF